MVSSRFPVVRRGYEPKAVDTALAQLADLAARVEHAEATTVAARTYAASLLDELDRLHGLEDDLTISLELARQTAQRMAADGAKQVAELISDAEVQAGARLAVAELEARHHLEQANEAATRGLRDARARADARWVDADARATSLLQEAERHVALRLAAAEHRANTLLSSAVTQSRDQLRDAETRSQALLSTTELRVAEQVAAAQAGLDERAVNLERYRQAVLEEIALLSRVEQRLGPRISRAAARLVEVVDAPDGLGAFTRTADTLVTVARLLQRANAAGTLAGVALSHQDGEVVVRLQTGAACPDLSTGTGTGTGTGTIDLRGESAAHAVELPLVSVVEPAGEDCLEAPVSAPRVQG